MMQPDTPLLSEVDKSVMTEPTMITGDEEAQRLAKKSPLLTFLDLSIGPTITQLVFSFYTIVNQYWIGKTIGDHGLQVIASIWLYDMVSFAFCNLFAISTSTQVSYLFGAHMYSDISQVVVDMLRLSLVIGAVYAAIVIPTTKLVVKWITSSSVGLQEAFLYQVISAGASFVSFFFYTLCGLLEGEGRAWLYGFAQFATLILDMLVFLPLFLFVFHWGVWAAALSGILSQLVPFLYLLFLLLRGKLSIRITARQFFAKHSSQSIKAISVGMASFILNFSEAFPHIYLQHFIYKVAEVNGVKESVESMWPIMTRLYMLSLSILAALDTGFLPAASYAYGQKNYSRIKALLFHMSWISFIWSATNSFVMSVFPEKIFGIFTKNKDALRIVPKLIWRIFATNPLYLIHEQVISYLQAVKRPTRATIVSVLTMVIPIPVTSTIIYYTKKNDLQWMFNTYLFEDAGTALISLTGLSTVLFRMWRLKDGEDFSDEGDSDDGHQTYTPVPSTSMDTLASLTQ